MHQQSGDQRCILYPAVTRQRLDFTIQRFTLQPPQAHKPSESQNTTKFCSVVAQSACIALRDEQACSHRTLA